MIRLRSCLVHRIHPYSSVLVLVFGRILRLWSCPTSLVWLRLVLRSYISGSGPILRLRARYYVVRLVIRLHMVLRIQRSLISSCFTWSYVTSSSFTPSFVSLSSIGSPFTVVSLSSIDSSSIVVSLSSPFTILRELSRDLHCIRSDCQAE